MVLRKTPVSKICPGCDSEFETFVGNKVYCSYDCNKKTYYRNHREHLIQSSVDWGRRNPDRRDAARQKWCENNPDYRQQYDPVQSRKYYLRRREAAIANAKRWAEQNRERRKEIARNWAKNNPDKANEATRRRRARLKGAYALPFTTEQLEQRLSMFPGCWVCGGEADSVDHVKPVNKGGAHILSNFRPICRPCNGSKSDQWPFNPETIRKKR